MTCVLRLCAVILALGAVSFLQPPVAGPVASYEYHSQTQIPETVRIGVFTLFRLRRIRCEAVQSPAHIRNETGRRVVIQPGERCFVVAENMELRLMKENGMRAKTILAGARLEVDEESSSGARIELEAVGRHTRLVRRFSGGLTFSNNNGMLRIVTAQKTEDATAAIVSSEMSGVKLHEALGALAVVVRSYLTAHVGRHAAEGYDFCDSTHCQLYFGEFSERNDKVSNGADNRATFALAPEAIAAARATQGEILKHERRCVAGYFTACCGGRTASPEAAFGGGSALSVQMDEGVACEWCRKAKFHRWRRMVNMSDALRMLASEWGSGALENVSLRVARRTAAGVVSSVALSDGNRSVIVPNTRFRNLVGRTFGWNTVLSNVFTLERRGDALIIQGRGFGHQVGLCVEGAIAQAQSGRNRRDILNFYFPKAEINAGTRTQ